MKEPAGNRPVAMRPPTSEMPMSLSSMIALARRSIAGVFGPFVLVTGIGILVTVVSQYNVQLINNFIVQARTDTAPAAEAKGGFDLMSSLLPSDTAWTAILFAVTGLLTIALGFSNRVGTVWLNARMVQHLQQKLHDKLLRLGMDYHLRHDQGENIAVITQYPGQAATTLRELIAFPVVRGVSLAVAILFLFYNLSTIQGQGPVLYGLLGAVVLLLPVGGVWLAGRMREASAGVRDKFNAVNNEIVDSLMAHQEVQLMGAVERRSRTFAASLTRLVGAQVRSAVQSEAANQFQVAVPLLLQVGLILWAVFVVPGESLQAVIGIYLFVPFVVDPVRELVRFYSTINSAWPSIEKVGQVLDAPEEPRDEGKLGVEALEGAEVVLDDVVYRPTPERFIIDHLSYRFPEGKVTALFGESGSGKSTVLRLVSRMFDPTAGKVTLGGIDLRELNIAALRSQVGVVSQSANFITADVRTNMRLAAPQVTDDEMVAACRQADIWGALEKMSPQDPLAAPVSRSAGGPGLSGGERRRLAIARVLLARPRVLLLDEPGAGVDAVRAAKIADEVRRLAPGRTVILVEHNVPLVQAAADIVCCLEGGRITDSGTPAELAARPSLFQKMMLAQRRSAVDAADYDVQASLPVRRVDVSAASAGRAKSSGAVGSPAVGGRRAPVE